MSWVAATVRGLLIVIYFVVATVWVPDKVAALDSVESASRMVRDLVVTAVWLVALGGGIFLLRRAQSRGLI